MMRPHVKVQPRLGDYRRHNRSTKPPNQARFKGTGGIHVRDNGILTMHQLVFAMLVQGGTRKEGYKNKICDVIDFLDTCCSWWNSTRHKFSGLQPDERCLSNLCF